MTTTDTKSTNITARIQNWTQDSKLTIHNLTTFEEADEARKTIKSALKKANGAKWEEKFQVKVRKYPLNGSPRTPITFSVLVFAKTGAA